MYSPEIASVRQAGLSVGADDRKTFVARKRLAHPRSSPQDLPSWPHIQFHLRSGRGALRLDTWSSSTRKVRCARGNDLPRATKKGNRSEQSPSQFGKNAKTVPLAAIVKYMENQRVTWPQRQVRGPRRKTSSARKEKCFRERGVFSRCRGRVGGQGRTGRARVLLPRQRLRHQERHVARHTPPPVFSSSLELGKLVGGGAETRLARTARAANDVEGEAATRTPRPLLGRGVSMCPRVSRSSGVGAAALRLPVLPRRNRVAAASRAPERRAAGTTGRGRFHRSR